VHEESSLLGCDETRGLENPHMLRDGGRCEVQAGGKGIAAECSPLQDLHDFYARLRGESMEDAGRCLGIHGITFQVFA
jgi:hypothetical protein